MKTIYNQLTKKTYVITNAPIEIGDLVALESGEIVSVTDIQEQHTLDALGGKVIKELKSVSAYIYPGLSTTSVM